MSDLAILIIAVHVVGMITAGWLCFQMHCRGFVTDIPVMATVLLFWPLAIAMDGVLLWMLAEVDREAEESSEATNPILYLPGYERFQYWLPANLKLVSGVSLGIALVWSVLILIAVVF